MTPNPDMGRHGIWEKCSEMTHSFHCFNFGTTTEILTDVSSNIPKNPISSEILIAQYLQVNLGEVNWNFRTLL